MPHAQRQAGAARVPFHPRVVADVEVGVGQRHTQVVEDRMHQPGTGTTIGAVGATVDAAACEIIGETTNRVCAGELLQVTAAGRLDPQGGRREAGRGCHAAHGHGLTRGRPPAQRDSTAIRLHRQLELQRSLLTEPVSAAAVKVAESPPVDVAAGRKFWSYKKPVKTTGSVDAFIEAKLKENRLTPSPEAEPVVLLRRLYFDLIGLPPAAGFVSKWYMLSGAMAEAHWVAVAVIVGSIVIAMFLPLIDLMNGLGGSDGEKD